MKWLLWLLWDPVAALDLIDTHGKPDHGKLMGFIGFLAVAGVIVLAMYWRLAAPTTAWLIVMVAPVFGWVGWRTFLHSRVVTATEQVTRQVSEQIAARRQAGAADGVEPTA